VNELERIALLRARLARDVPGVRVGIGDDAAVLDVGGGLVWTVDAQVSGTHFRPEWVSWEDIGWRSFMAAASDLAAMGSEPLASLSALVLGPEVDDAALDAFARGQAAAADAVGAPVVGGNLARGVQTSITTTLLGRAARPVLRSGARLGDGLWISGPIGEAAAGLAALAAGVHDPRVDACVHAWRRPRARIDDGRALSTVAHAAVDVSDGLARDASHLAEASGVRVVFDTAAVLLHAGVHVAAAASALRRDALDFVLHGGEDYALLAASDTPIPGFSRIGVIEAYTGGARIFLGDRAIEPAGFDHFAE
jgi:thiamine-monophosphate kinase